LGGHKADGTAELVNAAGDCITDPYLCTIDIASAIDEFNSVILTLIDAFAETCNAPFITPVGSSSLIHVRNPNKLRQELRDDLHKKLRGKGSGGYFDYQPGGINKKSHGGHHKHHHAHHLHLTDHRRLQETIALANSSDLKRITASVTEFGASLKLLQVLDSENKGADLEEGVPTAAEEDVGAAGRVYE